MKKVSHHPVVVTNYAEPETQRCLTEPVSHHLTETG